MKNLIKYFKSVNGQSLAEFAVTTAMMATLATTAAPKFSGVGEGAKEKKTLADIDKILKSANNFYNEQVTKSGRGRFPGQSKYNVQVGGTAYDNTDATSDGTDDALDNAAAHSSDILHDLGLNGTDGWQQYDDTPYNSWVSVFGTSNGMAAGTKGVENCDECSEEWLPLFGDEVLGSRFQDGHYAYTVVAGGGSGNDVFPPVLYVVDVENAVDFNSVLEP